MSSTLLNAFPIEVSARRSPYPFRAMLAICSDLDETPNRHVYWETARFLNTYDLTTMGAGVGLEVGNTIYFDMPPEQFSYWNTDDNGREMIRRLIQSGHIDCLHSFGDLATSREHAARALEELTQHGCSLNVWIDHGVAQSNFGSDIMQGYGDVQGSEVYHADLTCSYGIRYVWRGRVTSVIGQNVQRSFRGIYNWQHPVESTKTVLKEFVKAKIASVSRSKYAMHARNQLLHSTHLRSEQPVTEFLRTNPHWGGVSCGETAEGIPDVLTEETLNRLVQTEGVAVLYTHLGKVRRQEEPLEPQARSALRRLATFELEGKILVTTTQRLLKYCDMLRELSFSTFPSKDGLCIAVTTNAQNPSDWDGLSFYTADPERVSLSVNGVCIPYLQCNAPDHTGRASVSIPWRRLEFPRA